MKTASVGAPQKLTWWQIFQTQKENLSFKNVSIVTFKKIFHIPLPSNLFISFLNMFISLVELKNIH